MKVFSLLVLFLWVVVEALAVFTAYDSPLLKYIGHWDVSGKSQSGAISYYTGGSIQFSFTGSSLTLVLGNTLANVVTLLVSIDGRSDIYQKVYGSVLVTPIALQNNSTHDVMISPIMYSDNLIFQGAQTDGAVSKVQTTKFIFEFVGDSITAGYQTQFEALNSYAWLMPQFVGNHDRALVGFPGICLNNITCFGNIYGMSQQYFITQTEYGVPRPATPFNFNTTYQPTDIFINIGTNDFQYGITPENFASTLTSFVKRVRSVRPKARIHLMKLLGIYSLNNPATGTPPLHLYDPTVRQVATQLSADDSSVYYVDTTGFIEYPTVQVQSDGIHPTEAGHFDIARKLAAYWTAKNFS